MSRADRPLRTQTPRRLVAFVPLFALIGTPIAQADGLYINEIYFNQPGLKGSHAAPDSTHAYVELRGLPCATLTNTFLVILENEGDGSIHPGDAGSIETIFDLSTASLGTNGYLAIEQRHEANAQYNDFIVNPKATLLRNTGSGPGFGSAADSSIGAYSINNVGVPTGEFEGSGGTALLIQTDGNSANSPVTLGLNFDVDIDNNGLDVPNGHAGWTILDSIAYFGEANEADLGRTYAPLTYGFEPSAEVTWLGPGQTYVELPWPELEAEYIARWGNSTGSSPADWNISNLTDRVNPAGFTNTGDFRQSAEPHGTTNSALWETSHGVPYGTALTTTVGGPNYPLNTLPAVAGDFDGDGDVDTADLDEQWKIRFACGDLTGTDLLTWQQNFPTPHPIGAIPEPASVVLAGGLIAALGSFRRR